MEDITITHINSSSPEYGQVCELRDIVLRKPIGLSLTEKDLSKDHLDTIFIAQHHGAVIACLMLHPKDEQCLQLRQMAVAEGWQGRNIGSSLVIAAEQFSKRNRYTKIMLHARKTAIGFYERLGYSIVGDEFTEVGIPHFVMEKYI